MKLEKLLTTILFLSVGFILIFNIFTYDPIQGYDAEAHHEYVNNFFSIFIPGKSQLLPHELTREFFSPPLPYLFPAVIASICRDLVPIESLPDSCNEIFSYSTQVFQSIIFIFVIFIYLLSFQKLSKGKLFNFNVLITISILTVNYKAFSMIRGEPYIILFLSLLIYRLIILFQNSFNYEKKDILYFGVIIGCLALSRQWAFLIFPAIFFIVFFMNEKKIEYFKFITYSFVVGFLISSWFYFYLFLTYGSFTTFNANPKSFSFSNQDLSFYFSSFESFRTMFIKPIRPNFKNELIPILYSDVWGDYWGYFSFTSRSLDTGRNQMLIGDYLARVNIASLVPTFLFLLSTFKCFKIFKNKTKKDIEYIKLFNLLGIITTFIGFLWFLIKFPDPGAGDTIKAVYVIQLFYFMAFLSTDYLNNLRKKSVTKYRYIIVSLIFVFIHNFSAMLNHF